MVVELYCRHSCPLREITIEIKDHDRQLIEMLVTHGGEFKCVLCRKPLVIHWVMGPTEHEQYEEQHARMSVNYQIERQRQIALTGFGSVSLACMHDALPAVSK